MNSKLYNIKKITKMIFKNNRDVYYAIYKIKIKNLISMHHKNTTIFTKEGLLIMTVDRAT